MFRVLGMASISLCLSCVPMAQGGSLGPFDLQRALPPPLGASHDASMMPPPQCQSLGLVQLTPSPLLLPTGQWPPLVVLFACGWPLGLQAVGLPTAATARENLGSDSIIFREPPALELLLLVLYSATSGVTTTREVK